MVSRKLLSSYHVGVRNLALYLALALSTTAGAVTTSLKSLLTTSSTTTGFIQERNDGFSFLVKRNSLGQSLYMGIQQVQVAKPGRVNSVSVVALKEYLSPADRQVFNQMVVTVILKCFNLLPERKNAIVAWMDKQNQSAYRNVDIDFGPMQMEFKRDIDDSGTYFTKINMYRSGVPGVTPWTNYCTP